MLVYSNFLTFPKFLFRRFSTALGCWWKRKFRNYWGKNPWIIVGSRLSFSERIIIIGQFYTELYDCLKLFNVRDTINWRLRCRPSRHSKWKFWNIESPHQPKWTRWAKRNHIFGGVGGTGYRQMMPDDVIGTPRQLQTSINRSKIIRFW